ncbi:type II toxin-antitoxin system YafQ family toxin [Candidatus Magnetaquicoccus inordinatus]|uniref:type II toxin-antitoxin system RelE/ParE family toxin n=1 Tax=Candidatus Magnetaquicoccus inordinatus TaxID=2496818 RepID=UPI00102B9A88
MAVQLRTVRQFGKDLQKAKDRGKDDKLLWNIVDALLEGKPLDPRHRAHKLSGKWKDFWECHIEPNWLLLWLDDGQSITLVRTGTHADLF